jgi:hypothetical protein
MHHYNTTSANNSSLLIIKRHRHAKIMSPRVEKDSSKKISNQKLDKSRTQRKETLLNSSSSKETRPAKIDFFRVSLTALIK